MDSNLFYAILSMDAYNRGSNVGLILPDAGGAIGDANLIGYTDIPGDSFFEQTYLWNGKAVISYRGTDDPLGTNFLNGDLYNGWISAGVYDCASAPASVRRGRRPFGGLRTLTDRGWHALDPTRSHHQRQPAQSRRADRRRCGPPRCDLRGWAKAVKPDSGNLVVARPPGIPMWHSSSTDANGQVVVTISAIKSSTAAFPLTLASGA